MSKAIVSIGAGKLHKEMLDIAFPSFQAFSKKWGWDIYRCDTVGKSRPAPWYKIEALLNLLPSYDEVLFLGADTLIVDGSQDLTAPDIAIQALVEHHTGDGFVPNTDVWLCRKPMIPYLEKIWGMEQWLMHGWWEQAALLELMGYKVHQPTRYLGQPTELYDKTYFLEHSWNVHKWDQPQPEHPRIQHSTMHPDRPTVMKVWATQADRWIHELY
jgi:hypothetical protein